MAKSTNITWNERIVAMSINPDMATRKDIADMAAELVEINGREARATKFEMGAYSFKTRDEFATELNKWWGLERPAIVWVWGGDKK